MAKNIVILSFAALALLLAAVACGSSVPPSGATGTGGHVLLDIGNLATESDLVVLGVIESSEEVTKTVQDTSEPADLRVDDYTIQVEQISFSVSEFLKGKGDGTITITLPSEGDNYDPNGTVAKMEGEDQYVVFLFDPGLRIGEADNFWGDTYLAQGAQGVWRVSDGNAQRLNPPDTLTLENLKSQVRNAPAR